jgi:hypothetical protein
LLEKRPPKQYVQKKYLPLGTSGNNCKIEALRENIYAGTLFHTIISIREPILLDV